MMKADRRANKRHKQRYGHFGAGSVHTRQASDLEVWRHVEKALEKNRRRKRWFFFVSCSPALAGIFLPPDRSFP